MTRLPILHEPYLATLFSAQLICEVCQLQPWTTRARWCDALLCADCASGEPEPEDHTDEALTDEADFPPLDLSTCPQCHTVMSFEWRACMRCHGPTDCLCCDCEEPALITPESYL